MKVYLVEDGLVWWALFHCRSDLVKVFGTSKFSVAMGVK